MKLESILVGTIVNAHGIRGEVRVQPRDGDPHFLTEFRTFYIDGRPVVPTASHVHKSLVLMKFPGVDDMNAALAMKGRDLYIRRADARLPDGAWFDDELLDLEVFDDTGAPVGRLSAVENYPAHKVYTVQGAGRTYLIPAVAGVFIQSIDMNANRMVVHLLEGL